MPPCVKGPLSPCSQEHPKDGTLPTPTPPPTEDSQSPVAPWHPGYPSPSPYTRYLFSLLPNGDADIGPTPPCLSQEFSPPDTPSFAPSTSPDSPRYDEVVLTTQSIRQGTDLNFWGEDISRYQLAGHTVATLPETGPQTNLNFWGTDLSQNGITAATITPPVDTVSLHSQTRAHSVPPLGCLCPPTHDRQYFHRATCPINNLHTSPHQHTRNTSNYPFWEWYFHSRSQTAPPPSRDSDCDDEQTYSSMPSLFTPPRPREWASDDERTHSSMPSLVSDHPDISPSLD